MCLLFISNEGTYPNEVYVLILVLIVVIGGISYGIISPQFGENPQKEQLQRISSSPNYDKKNNKFINKNEELLIKANAALDTWQVTWDFMFPRNQVTPDETTLRRSLMFLNSFQINLALVSFGLGILHSY